MNKLLLICLLFGGIHPALAQDTPSPHPIPPAGPLLNRAPDFSRWVIVIKRPKAEQSDKSAASQSGAKPGPQTTETRVTTTKTGPVREEEEIGENGSKAVKWYNAGMQVTMKTGWTIPVLSSAATNPFDELLTDYSKTDFPGFEWISAKNYLGTKNVAGRDCLVFKDKASVISDEELNVRKEVADLSKTGDTKAALQIDPEQFLKEAVAYVDFETRLPVALLRSDEVRTYQFNNPPQAMLVLPADMQAPITIWNKMKAGEARPAARPY